MASSRRAVPEAAMTSSPKELPLFEKLDAILGIGRITFDTLITLLLSPFRGNDTPASLYQHVLYYASRRMATRLSVAQGTYLFPSTSDVYAQIAKKNGVTPRDTVLTDGTKAHWLGDENAESVLLWLHGGGFVRPATSMHIQYLWDLQEYLKREGHEVAVLILAYDLAPAATYPRALQQAVALLDHLLNTAGRDPRTIYLGGDSAGGNLALAVLSHTAHPHPSVPQLDVACNFPGVVLLSPWVNLEGETESATRNESRDIIANETLKAWADIYMGGAPSDPYSEPVKASEDWWVGAKTDEILNVTGTYEIMLDDIKVLGDRLQAAVETTTVIAPGEPHIAPVAYRILGYKDSGQQEVAIQSWLSQRLSAQTS